MKRISFIRLFHVFALCVLMSILLGSLYQQYVKHQQPCPLCFLQRLGMIGIGAGIAMNLHFGIRNQHYSIALGSAFFGSMVSLRHIALHICPTFPTFGKPVFGLSLYTWAFITFICSIFSIIVLMFMYSGRDSSHHYLSKIERIAIIIFMIIITTNVITVFYDCGFGLCQELA